MGGGIGGGGIGRAPDMSSASEGPVVQVPVTEV